MGRCGVTLARYVAGLLAATALLGALPSAAVGGSKEAVAFDVSGIEVISERTVAERGANLTVVGWHFEALINDSTEPSICCDLNLRPLTWVWNTATGAGNLEATWESHHFFDPIRWEGRLWGRVSARAGSGQLHMTEINSGATFHGTWTSPPIDPLGDGTAGLQGWTFEVAGTMG